MLPRGQRLTSMRRTKKELRTGSGSSSRVRGRRRTCWDPPLGVGAHMAAAPWARPAHRNAGYRRRRRHRPEMPPRLEAALFLLVVCGTCLRFSSSSFFLLRPPSPERFLELVLQCRVEILSAPRSRNGIIWERRRAWHAWQVPHVMRGQEWLCLLHGALVALVNRLSASESWRNWG
jgi:hypothetical protein